MKKILARIGLATMLAAGSLAAVAPVAHAQDMGVEFRFGGDDRDGPRYADDDNYGPRQGMEVRHHRWRDGEMRQGCRPQRAVDKARYQGLRNARISRVTPRVVVVKGRGPYGWERMVFANVRGCPMIDN